MAHGAPDGQGHPVLIPILPLDHSNKSVTSLINMAPTPKTTSRSALPTPRSLTDDIMRLAAMKQEGLLTAEEFALAKARLLGLPSARQLTILQLISRLHHAGASWEDACEPVRHELERRVALLPPAAASHQGPFPPPPEGHTAPLSTSEKAVRPVSPPRVAKSPRSTSAPRRISDELEKKPQITHALADAQASVHAEVHAEVHGDAQARREPRAPLTRTTGAVLPKVKVAVVGGQEELIQEGNATSFYALRPDPGPSLDWASALRSGAAPGRPAPSPPSTVSIASSRVGVDKSLRFSGSGSPGQATSPPGTLHGSGTGDQPKRFRELIQDEYFAVSFAAYLEGARAHELLAFFREVEAWITLEDRGTQREKAFLMYQKFLAPGAVNELNIDETSRKACFAELSTSDWNRNLFNETQGEVVSLLEAEFLPKFLRSEVGLSYSTRSRSTRKEKSQGVGQLFGRLSLSNNNASDTRPSNKIEPRSGKDGFVSPPVSPKGPAMSQSSSGPVVPRKGTGTSNGTTSPRRAVSPRKALSPGRSKSPEPITRP